MEVNNLSYNTTNYNNTSFGTLKKIRIKNSFDLNWKPHRAIIDEFNKSEPIKEFFKKYDGYADFERTSSLSPVYNSCNVTLKFKNPDRKTKNIFERILSKLMGYSCEISIDGRRWDEYSFGIEEMLLNKLKTLKTKELEEAVKSTTHSRFTYIFAKNKSIEKTNL